MDERGLQNCSECDGFPCNRLVEWAEQYESYTGALKRLQQMSEGHQEPSDKTMFKSCR